MITQLLQLVAPLLQRWQGSRTYVAGALLAGLGVLLLAKGGDTTFALFLIAQGGGLAALRSSISGIQTFLTSLQQRLDSVGKAIP
jgi:hypothetical protein